MIVSETYVETKLGSQFWKFLEDWINSEECGQNCDVFDALVRNVEGSSVDVFLDSSESSFWGRLVLEKFYVQVKKGIFKNIFRYFFNITPLESN